MSGPNIVQHKGCPCFKELQLSPGPLGNLLTPLSTTCRAKSSWWSGCHASSCDKAGVALCSGAWSLVEVSPRPGLSQLWLRVSRILLHAGAPCARQ